MDNNQSALLNRAYGDFNTRTKTGMFVHPLFWFMISLTYQYHLTQQTFFIVNSIVILLIFGTRMVQAYLLPRMSIVSADWSHSLLVGLILVTGLHWGLMAAWSVVDPNYADTRFILVLIAASLGIAGSTLLSISATLRIVFPFLALGPLIIVWLSRGQREDIVLALMGLLVLIYVQVMARISGRDYWRSINNQLLAEQRAQQMEQLSITDPLTQLKNRTYFDRYFRQEWKRNNRQQTPLSLLMLDLDHFKWINDNHGHVCGDFCLRQMAEILSIELHRETDIIARYGGEEFVILLPDTDITAAAAIAKRLLEAVAEAEIVSESQRITMTCSIGGATAYPDFMQHRESLLKQADDALYHAKANGRNQYRAFASLDYEAAYSA